MMNITFDDDFFNWANSKQERTIDGFDDFEDEYPNKNRRYPEIEDESGWGTPWPTIPGGGEPQGEFWKRNGSRGNECPCEDKNVMGYYIPWHIILNETYRNGQDPNDIRNIQANNDSRDESRKWGIHLCMKNIKAYIDYRLIPSVEKHITNHNEIEFFRDYATYLLIMKTTAHEWGHYRTEVLALQQMEGLSTIMSDKDVSFHSGNYLKHFRKNTGKKNNFEEVFAQWCALRYGIFNAQLMRPDNLRKISWTDQQRLTKDWLIRYGILQQMQANHSPYGDISRWVDFDSLNSSETLNLYVNGDLKMSRVVGKNTFYRNEKMIDLMMHNINAFSKSNFRSHRHRHLLSKSNPSMFREKASTRIGVGLNSHPQTPSFVKGTYSNKRKTKGVLYFDDPIDIPSFKDKIYRLPIKNYKILSVKVYLHY